MQNKMAEKNISGTSVEINNEEKVIPGISKYTNEPNNDFS